ncbi:putative ATPase involved in cell division [Bernardetia litoralis DSM 6794]|uniref:Cell division ATP-binding protein FtsE n=1 Tax=Bernardetia litoralis (strain ATCC 23117 / DSM 6794 / NBRC 15988 / NCIMB 1366 / Fx l1 / Sio-4) TaxID=880071 RepID=I4AQH9_BERLS|nr:ATP-binding cassette domain-containing protein [Bernardetia litoralis]AFM06214.1 putative ATPase involved in cell division [Bernardetia litoralis DSM 6794]
MTKYFSVASMQDVLLAQESRTIFEKVNLEVASGEFVYLIGKTGSGKSTILKALYADLPVEDGKIIVAGYRVNHLEHAEIPFLRRKIGIVFQDFQLFTDRSVFENLAFVMRATGWIDKVAIQHRIDKILKQVGIDDLMYKMPHQLSGGEQQRVAIARALLNDPLIVLADEPTGNLDPTIANDILNVFVEINKAGTAVLMATHHHNFLKKHPARVFYCENGQVKDIDRNLVIQKMTD